MRTVIRAAVRFISATAFDGLLVKNDACRVAQAGRFSWVRGRGRVESRRCECFREYLLCCESRLARASSADENIVFTASYVHPRSAPASNHLRIRENGQQTS